MIDFKNIDWRSLQRLTNPQAMKDFDAFLDSLPLNVGYNALIAAGIAWVLAGGSVLFTSMEVEKVSKLRSELLKIEALQPPIPVLKYTPVSKAAIEALALKIEATYPGIKTLAEGEGKVLVTGSDTDYFPQFLAAISTLQNGGKNWKVKVDSMCIGRDCKTAKLTASLLIDSVRVDIPPPQVEEEATEDSG